MRENVIAQIRAHIVEQWLNSDDRGLTDDSDLQSIGVLDSFSTLALASYLSDTYPIRLEPVDINAETFRSVNSLTELVLVKLAQESSGS
jgi:acyl carrier protein